MIPRTLPERGNRRRFCTLHKESSHVIKTQTFIRLLELRRMRALLEGGAAGIELNYLNLTVEETFIRMIRNREFDVAELSLSSYT